MDPVLVIGYLMIIEPRSQKETDFHSFVQNKTPMSVKGLEVGQEIWGMDKLPQELIDYICDHVTDKVDSKNLRLLSRSFNDRATLNVSRIF